MNDFGNEIEKFFKANDKLIVFDVGCFQGEFSKKIKKKFKNSIFYFIFRKIIILNGKIKKKNEN